MFLFNVSQANYLKFKCLELERNKNETEQLLFCH